MYDNNDMYRTTGRSIPPHFTASLSFIAPLHLYIFASDRDRTEGTGYKLEYREILVPVSEMDTKRMRIYGTE